MDQASDFSFHKGNPLAVSDDEPGSPKPMPQQPLICNVATDTDAERLLNLDEAEALPSVALEVIDTLCISPARSSLTNKESCQPSTLSELDTSTSGPFIANLNGKGTDVPKFSSDGTASSSQAKATLKVPLEKGYSQLDWLRLTQTQTFLAGFNYAASVRLITKEAVKEHKVVDDAWTVLKGRVYNITPYFRFHPGGVDMLMKAAGKDCTALFNKYHSWVNAEFLLEKCFIGFLDTDS